MEDINILENDNNELPVQGSGSILAAERKKQNKTVDEIASELNLTETQIRTIELDQTDGLPEPTYVRGYIRSYANLLGLDAGKVLNNYLNANWQQSRKLDDMPRGIDSVEKIESTRGFRFGRFFLLLVCVAVGYLWYSGTLGGLFSNNSDAQITASPSEEGTDYVFSPNEGSPESNGEVSDAAEALQNTVDGSLRNAADGSLGDAADGSLGNAADGSSDSAFSSLVSADPSSNASQGSSSSDVSESTPQGQIVTNDPVQVDSSVAELVLNFTQTSWVDIRDEANTRLAYKSFVAGEELIVSNEGAMSVFLGNAEGVVAYYNGEPFDIEQYREGVYAKFSVNED